MARKRADSRRVSQADVARRAEVSTGIVSSVISGRDYGSIRISEATRERVWAAVRELGYVPNLAARNLARGSNRLIGVFTYRPMFPLASRDFYHDFLVGIEEAAEEASYNMLLVTGARTETGARSVYADGVNNLQLADGAVMLGSGEDVDELARMTAEGYRYVYIGQRRPPGVELSYVAADYASGTADIVSRLYSLGHRRIAMVQEPGDGEPVPARRPGFLRGCDEVGLTADDRPVFVLGGRPVVDQEGEFVASPVQLVQRARDLSVTALVVERAADAELLRDAAEQTGLRLPRDLSLASLAVPPEPIHRPGLAQLLIPRREMGQEAVRLLLQLVRPGTGGPLRTTMECGFDPGSTFGPAPIVP